MFWINIWQESLTWRHSMTTTILGNNKTSCIILPLAHRTSFSHSTIIHLYPFVKRHKQSFDTFQAFHSVQPHLIWAFFQIWPPNSQCTILGGFLLLLVNMRSHEITTIHPGSLSESLVLSAETHGQISCSRNPETRIHTLYPDFWISETHGHTSCICSIRVSPCKRMELNDHTPMFPTAQTVAAI